VSDVIYFGEEEGETVVIVLLPTLLKVSKAQQEMLRLIAAPPHEWLRIGDGKDFKIACALNRRGLIEMELDEQPSMDYDSGALSYSVSWDLTITEDGKRLLAFLDGND
jgi:hypothetical protein